MENIYEDIPRESFEFINLESDIHDEKFKTKSRSFFQDVLARFKKNQSSVIAFYIILLLILFAIFSPIISQYSIKQKDNVYVNFAPFIRSVADKKIGIFDSASSLGSQSESQIFNLHAIGVETGMDPVIRLTDRTETTSIYRGKERVTYSYAVEVNSFYNVGIKLMGFSYDEFDAIQKFQNETGIQVVYPIVDKALAYPTIKDLTTVSDNANVWYQCSDAKQTAIVDADGNRIPAYSTNTAKEGATYYSQRIAGDPGNYIYSLAKSGSVQCRVCYYNYYIFKYGHEPNYIFGTDAYGRDLFCAIGIGARFSLLFALFVSVINIIIGTIYGSVQGYYGGATDMLMDRITDVLGNIDMLVVVKLLQIYLGPKFGAAGAFFLAYVATGWIGISSLTRKQFYRFKSQEYVTAARTLGASDKRLMFKHILPNSIGTMITSISLIIPSTIRSETSIIYLGIVNISTLVGTTLGDLMSEGHTAMTASPHAMFYPSVYFALLMISFNLFGNGLRDAFNPTTRGTEG